MSSFINTEHTTNQQRVVCSRCKKNRPIEDFHKISSTSNERRKTCKYCQNQLKKHRYHVSSLEDRLKGRLRDALYRAQKKDIAFDLTVQDLIEIWKKQNGLCYYTDIDLPISSLDRQEAISIDRIDSQKGYTKDNVCLCLWKVNNAKGTLTREQFYSMCKQVLDTKEKHEEEAREEGSCC